MQSTATCSIEGCDRQLRARGWCATHWARWRHRGDVNWVPEDGRLERFLKKVDKSESCWIWKGFVGPSHGYGVFEVKGKRFLAHRWAYESLVGTIPDGLHIDHLCRERRCVNPEHLEPVTPEENARRAGRYISGRFAECQWGHPITAENTYIKSNGARGCLTCYRARNKRPRRPLKEIFGS